MKTKLLFLSALFVFSFSAFAGAADFSGSYGGMLTVAVDPENPTLTEDTLTLALQADGYYTLTISDFSYSGMAIGDIVVDSIQISHVNGVDTLVRDGSFAGPTVSSIFNTIITLEEGAIYSGQALGLGISVSVPLMSMTIPVYFVGGKIVAANAETTIQNIAIVPSLASESIRVQAEAGSNYVIYSIAGSAVKSGVLNDEEIDISALPSGTYFFVSERKSAKFIKK